MIRVAHLIQSAETRAGGTTTAFFNIFAAAAGASDDLDLHAYFPRPPEGDPVWETIRKDPGRFHLAKSAGRRLVAGDVGRLIATDLAADTYDLLHIHGVWSPDLVMGARAALKAGVPYIWQSHGMLIRWAWNYKRLKKRLFLLLGLQRCLNRADSFILMSRDELEGSVYPSTITPSKRHLIPLPVEMPESNPRRGELAARGRERFGLPAESPVLAFMGRLHPVKRVDMTIRAFALAAASRPELRLLLLGKGDTDEYEQQLRSLARELGVGEQVVFAGWVLGEDKTAGLCAAGALVLNSSLESFGYVLFEAIGAGTPAVVTENLSLAGDFEAAGAAIVTPNSVEGLAAGMLEALSGGEGSGSVERARAWARREFSREAVGGKLLAAYRQAAGRAPG